ANPVVGSVADILIEKGATGIFSEPVELVGTESVLPDRCVSPDVVERVLSTIDKYVRAAHDAGVDLTGVNPTPDNIAGGLTTIEEKSLGALAKSGSTPLMGVLEYGERPEAKGLWL